MNTKESRPRLADHVSLRQHVRGDDAWVIVRDGDGGSALKLGAREGAVLLAADGTRDHHGIALAARRRGAQVSAESVEALFASLAEHGLLVDGPPEHDPEVATLGEPGSGLPQDREIVSLPGYRFHCEGAGACCRQYESVLLAPADRARASAAYAGQRVGPWAIEHAFPPQRGSAPSPVRVATTRDDGCMFLQPDGLCGIHCRAGADAKPAGCQLFPLRLVDDGERVRATALTECRCVLDPAPEGAPPLVAPGTSVRDLSALTVVRRLPEEVPCDGETMWSRARVRAWSADAIAQLEQSSDPAQWCWDEAEALRSSAASRPTPHAWFRELARRSNAFSTELEKWRSPSDHLCRAARWVSLSALVLADAEVATALVDVPPDDPGTERLATQLMLWGFVGLGGNSLAAWLRDRAVRLWVARAMLVTRTQDCDGAVFDQPIATLDALLRGHGLRDYHLNAAT